MDDVQVLEVLRSARQDISDPNRWTRGHVARDIEGLPTQPAASNAVSFCSVGVLAHQSVRFHDLFEENMFLYSYMWNLLDDKAQKMGWNSVVNANDDERGGHATVLAIFDAVIADLEAELIPAPTFAMPELVLAG